MTTMWSSLPNCLQNFVADVLNFPLFLDIIKLFPTRMQGVMQGKTRLY